MHMCSQYLLSSLIPCELATGATPCIHFTPFPGGPSRTPSCFWTSSLLTAPRPFLLSEASLKDGSVTCQAAPGPQHFPNLCRKVRQDQGQCPFLNSWRQVSSCSVRQRRYPHNSVSHPHTPCTPSSVGAGETLAPWAVPALLRPVSKEIPRKQKHLNWKFKAAWRSHPKKAG